MLFICVHASVCMHVHVCAPWHTRRVKGQLVEVGSALYHVDPGDQPQGVRLGGKGLCLLSHLINTTVHNPFKKKPLVCILYVTLE